MSVFQFKYFSISQYNSTLKVGTDAMLLGAFLPQDKFDTILDIGAGTGVLSLMAKQLNPQAKVLALENDEKSILDCRLNFSESIWKEDVSVLYGDFFTFESTDLFDCIVCNPPYYEDGFLSANSSINKAKHTLDFNLSTFFEQCKSLLCKHGELWMILPIENAEKWKNHVQSTGYFVQKWITIYSKANQAKRVIFCLQLIETKTETIDFTIRNEDNSYTEQYKIRTKVFHSKTL